MGASRDSHFRSSGRGMASTCSTDGLEHVGGLFGRADGREWLAVLPTEEYLRLVRKGKVVMECVIETHEN